MKNYNKIPKINPGIISFQRPFLRGLFLERLIFRRAYLRREICVSKRGLFSEFYGSVECYPTKAEEQPSRCIIAVEI